MKTIIKIITILLALGIWSCGSRKVTIDKSKEETKTETVDNSVIEKQVDTNVKETTTIVVNDKNEVLSTEEEIKPLDSSKPALFTDKEGKQIKLNNSIYTKKTKTSKNNTQSELVKKTDELKKESEKDQKAIKQKQEEKKESKAKQVESEGLKWYSFWWLYAIIALILFFLYNGWFKKIFLLFKK